MHLHNAPLALLLITLSLTILTLPTTTTARAVRHHSYRHGHVALSSHPYARSAHKTRNVNDNAHNLPHHHQHHQKPPRTHVAAVRVPPPPPRMRMSSFRRVWEWGRGRVGGGNVTAENTAAGNIVGNSGIGHGTRDGPNTKAVMRISGNEFAGATKDQL